MAIIPRMQKAKLEWRILAIVAILFVVVPKVVMWWSYKSRHDALNNARKAISSSDSLDVKMKKMAEVAVALGRQSGHQDLDYSTESLKAVDAVLVRVLGKTKDADREETIGTACLIWGAYVGEVIRKHHGGGEWSEGKDGTGHGTYPLQVQGQTIYPCQWCVQDVQFAESVWEKYQSFAVNGFKKEEGSNIPTITADESVEVRMRKASEFAILMLDPQERRYLDFSAESLKKVDEFLEQVPQKVSKTNANEEMFYTCVAWGAYVGEVIRKKYGGTWFEKEKNGEAELPSLEVDGQTICPSQWAIDRLEKGTAGSVWRKYQTFELEKISRSLDRVQGGNSGGVDGSTTNAH